jgi:hypothetical protein
LQFQGPAKDTLNELIKLVDSLRSQLAKGGLQTFVELFKNLKKSMDCTLDAALPHMVRRAADTNQFISQEAEIACLAACQYCTETKVLTALQALSNVKAANIKEKYGMCIVSIIEKLGTKLTSFRDLDKITSCLAGHMNDANQDVR